MRSPKLTEYLLLMIALGVVGSVWLGTYIFICFFVFLLLEEEV